MRAGRPDTWLPALSGASLAIGALVVAGYQSLWYALAATVLFAVAMAVRAAISGARRGDGAPQPPLPEGGREPMASGRGAA